jgi:hypothetical protein
MKELVTATGQKFPETGIGQCPPTLGLMHRLLPTWACGDDDFLLEPGPGATAMLSFYPCQGVRLRSGTDSAMSCRKRQKTTLLARFGLKGPGALPLQDIEELTTTNHPMITDLRSKQHERQRF